MEANCFAVEYNNHRQILRSPTESSIRESFGIGSSRKLFVQCYNDTFDCYIDCSWNEIPMLKSKKLLVNVETNGNLNLVEAKAETNIDHQKMLVELDTNTSYERSLSKATTVDVMDDENTVIDIVDEEPLQRQNAFCIKESSTSKVKQEHSKSASVPQKQYEILPASYVMPYINPLSKLGKALNEQKPLSRALKGQFLTTIYENFAHKNTHSIGHQYSNIVHAILNEYPYLGMGLPYHSAKHLWIKSLYAKFANEKSRDLDKESIIRVKAKKLKESEKNISGSELWGVPNYHPVLTSEDEDVTSIESHRSWMDAEIKKVKPNLSAITKRMDLTFKDRRNLLFISDCNLNILTIYPALACEMQAIEEVERLFGKNHHISYSNYIDSFAAAMNDAVISSKSIYKKHLDQLMKVTNTQTLSTKEKYMLIGNIAVLVQESPSAIISTELNETGSPMLLASNSGSVTLIVNGKPCIQNISAANAAFLWLSSFYIFDIKIEAKLKKCFEVLQHLFFNLPAEPKFNQTCAKILHAWHKLG